jgi:hypothetical protein
MHPNNRMSLLCLSTFSLALVLTLVGCGEPERPQRTAAIAQPFRFGGDFNEVGKISFFQGESCASQIMFVFDIRLDVRAVSGLENSHRCRERSQNCSHLGKMAAGRDAWLLLRRSDAGRIPKIVLVIVRMDNVLI